MFFHSLVVLPALYHHIFNLPFINGKTIDVSCVAINLYFPFSTFMYMYIMAVEHQVSFGPFSINVHASTWILLVCLTWLANHKFNRTRWQSYCEWGGYSLWVCYILHTAHFGSASDQKQVHNIILLSRVLGKKQRSKGGKKTDKAIRAKEREHQE